MHTIKSARHLRCIEAIQNDRFSTISFDVFDTLLLRRLWEPTDLFEVMERDPAIREIIGDRDFADQRYKAERALRLAAKEVSPLVDPTLDDIYDNFQKLTGLSTAQCRELAQLETAFELRFIAPRTAALPLFEQALASGKTVILASDMYLPRETITAMLTTCGYEGYDRLYISCELNATKKDDALFRYIARDLDQPPESILHFGDNKHSDLAMAKQAGWSPMLVVAPRDQLVQASTRGMKGLVAPLNRPSDLNEPATRASFGLIKGRVLSDHLDPELTPAPDDDTDLLRRFGYTALGPFVLSLALWVRRIARKQTIAHVAWLARDGDLPMRATHMLDDTLGPAFRSTYLPISRKLIFPYLLNQPGGIEQILKIGYKRGFPVYDFVKERFGPTGLDALSAAAGDDAAFVLAGVMDDYHDLVCDAMRAQADRLAAAAAEQDQALQSYFRKTIRPDERSALFDVGRKGTFQAVLNQICDQQLHGFYVTNSYEIHRNAPDHAFSSFLGVIDRQKQSKAPDTMLYEAFLSEKAPGFTGFTADGTALRGGRDISDGAKAFYQVLQDSALDYVRDAIALYGQQVVMLEQDPFFGAYGLENWLQNDTARTLLDAAPHEDPVSTVQDKSLMDYFVTEREADQIDFFLPQRRAEKRIALYCPAITRIRGGAERIGARVANALHAAGYEVLVFSSGQPTGSIAPVFPLAPGILVRNVDTRAPDQIAKLVADFAPDAGLILASGPAVLPVSLGFLDNAVPYLLSERACPDHCMKTYWKGFDARDYHIAHEAADMAAVQFPSFRRHFPAHMQDHVAVLANPIEMPDTIVPAGQRQKIILCAARIWFEQKRQNLLLDAFAQIAERHPDWRLVFYGNAYHDDRDKLQAAAEAHGLSDRIAIHDATPDLPDRLDEASIFVLPSAFEGFPNALAEALASGLPAIGFSACAGVNELIQDGETGFLVLEDDLVAMDVQAGASAGDLLRISRLSEALDRMMRDDAFRAGAGAAAHRFMQTYEAGHVLQSWMDTVQRLTEMPKDRFLLPRRHAIAALNAQRTGQNAAPAAQTPAAPEPAKPPAAGPALDPLLAETVPHLQDRIQRTQAPVRAALKRLLGAKIPPPPDMAAFIQDSLAQYPDIKLPVPDGFDEDRYLSLNPDIAEAVQLGMVQSGYVHYILYGHAEGRSA